MHFYSVNLCKATKCLQKSTSCCCRYSLRPCAAECGNTKNGFHYCHKLGSGLLLSSVSNKLVWNRQCTWAIKKIKKNKTSKPWLCFHSWNRHLVTSKLHSPISVLIHTRGTCSGHITRDLNGTHCILVVPCIWYLTHLNTTNAMSQLYCRNPYTNQYCTIDVGALTGVPLTQYSI